MDKTKEEFLAWLRALPPETVFDHLPNRDWCETCPIAQFTGRPAHVFSYSPSSWQRRFMARIDQIDGAPLLADAIRIAESL
jgi:hypothetical protein